MGFFAFIVRTVIITCLHKSGRDVFSSVQLKELMSAGIRSLLKTLLDQLVDHPWCFIIFLNIHSYF